MKKLLIIEDNNDFLQLLYSVLQKDFQVYQATGTKEAQAILETVTVNAICSDYNLLDGTGLELRMELRHSNIETPFLLMSGYDNYFIADMAKKHNATFCCKTDYELIERIRNL